MQGPVTWIIPGSAGPESIQQLLLAPTGKIAPSGWSRTRFASSCTQGPRPQLHSFGLRQVMSFPCLSNGKNLKKSIHPLPRPLRMASSLLLLVSTIMTSDLEGRRLLYQERKRRRQHDFSTMSSGPQAGNGCATILPDHLLHWLASPDHFLPSFTEYCPAVRHRSVSPTLHILATPQPLSSGFACEAWVY